MLNILSLFPLSKEQKTRILEVRSDITLSVAKRKEAAPYLKDTDILLSYGGATLCNMNELYPKMPHLQWVHTYSAGVEGVIASAEFVKSPIILTNSGGIHGITIAEHILGVMISFTRSLHIAHTNQLERCWKALPKTDELFEKTAAIIGLGNIGHTVAKYLKNMGMRVLAVRQKMTDEEFVDELYPMEKLDYVLRASDYVILALPLTSKTEDLFTKERFQQMKNSAILINIARGPIVNDADLIDALESGEIAGAALDVFAEEPLPQTSPLWEAPNVLITPHSSALSPKYMDRSLALFCESLRHFPDISKMVNVLDKTRGY